MKKLIALLTVFIGLQANAGVISLALSNDAPEVGESVLVTVSGSDFSGFDSLDLNIEFDTGVFAVDNTDVLGDIDPLTVGGDLASSGGLLALSSQPFGVALSFVDFFLFAGGDFSIATFSLTAISASTADFVTTDIVAGAFDLFSGGVEPVDATAEDRSVSATVTQTVPTPAMLSLLLLGLAGVFFARR